MRQAEPTRICVTGRCMWWGAGTVDSFGLKQLQDSSLHLCLSAGAPPKVPSLGA